MSAGPGLPLSDLRLLCVSVAGEEVEGYSWLPVRTPGSPSQNPGSPSKVGYWWLPAHYSKWEG